MANMEKFGRQNLEKEAQPADGSENVDAGRRGFLKAMGIGAAGAVVGAAVMKGCETVLVPGQREEKKQLSDDEIIGREVPSHPKHELSDDEIIGREAATNRPQHELSDDEIIGRNINKK